jgi:hypothetical protein
MFRIMIMCLLKLEGYARIALGVNEHLFCKLREMETAENVGG